MKDTKNWKVNFIIYRQKEDGKKEYQTFRDVEVNPDEYVLDGIEKVWAFHDRSLCFRHACHHSTCGACGMVINGVEKLTCITPIHSVTHDGGTIKAEPLRNFPVVSDLVVDMGQFYLRMGESGLNQVATLEQACLPYERNQQVVEGDYERLVDCIECGLCISACPAAATSSSYLGPGVIAGIQHTLNHSDDNELILMADSQNGVWRCHSAFECSAVCPSNVDPAYRIMALRRKVITHRIRNLF